MLLFLVAVFGPARIAKAPEHIVAFFIKPPEAQILFVGDMLFDRYIRQVMDARGGDYIFSCIGEFLSNADAVVGNLEGPITSSPSVSMGTTPEQPENFRFTFPPETAELLKKYHVSVVTIGNNHIGNLGIEGIASTKQYLTDAGVAYFGDDAIYRTKINGVLLSFVNYNEFGNSTPQKVVEMIAAERGTGRIVIVYAHWGEEYQEPPERVRKPAHLFIDAGAVAVFGSHPHIVQEHELYKGKDIYYSLGNFIFDQYWDTSVSRGLAVLLTISKDGVSAQEYSLQMLRDGRTCLAT